MSSANVVVVNSGRWARNQPGVCLSDQFYRFSVVNVCSNCNLFTKLLTTTFQVNNVNSNAIKLMQIH